MKTEQLPPTTAYAPSWMGDTQHETPGLSSQPPQTVPPPSPEYQGVKLEVYLTILSIRIIMVI